MKLNFILLLLLLLLLVNTDGVYLVNNDDTLVMSNILYRHGARSPTRFYKTNPNQVDAWPDGTGRLTQIGIMMEYNLGKFLNDRYVTTKFINQSYLHKEVYIRSSSVDRCLQSAESQIAGLYPPKGSQIWSKDIAWQPIPVHTVPTDKDPLLKPARADCPRIGEIRKEMLATYAFKKEQEKNKELLDFMTQKSGQPIDLTNLWDVTDDLLCEQAEHMPSANWTVARFSEILNLSNWAKNYMFQGSNEFGRLLGGALLKKMRTSMQNMKDGQTEDVYKLNIFSGHDSSVLALSTALNIRFPMPTFTACVLIELYKTTDSDYYVTINYRNGIENETLIPLSLEKCQYKCSLSDFWRLTKNRIPVDRAKECHSPPSCFFTKKRLQVISAVLFALTAFFFFVILWMCMRKKCQKSRKHSNKSISNANEEDDHEFANLLT